MLLQSDINNGLQLAETEQPDVILLDILMYDIDGYEVCRRLKENNKTKHIPIIFLSSLVKTTDKVKGFEAGGVDYITKPFDIDEMVVRIESCLKVHSQLNQSQKYLMTECEARIKEYQLSRREVEILKLYVLGFKRNKIAEKLFISEFTVKNHLKNILNKLTVKTRHEVILKARDMGLLD